MSRDVIVRQSLTILRDSVKKLFDTIIMHENRIKELEKEIELLKAKSTKRPIPSMFTKPNSFQPPLKRRKNE